MKLAVFVLFIILSAVHCQTEKQIQGCVDELNVNLPLVKYFYLALKGMDVLSMTGIISNLRSNIDSTYLACKTITKQQILTYSSSLNIGQRECFASVMDAFNSTRGNLELINERRWTEIHGNLKAATEVARNCLMVCDGKF